MSRDEGVVSRSPGRSKQDLHKPPASQDSQDSSSLDTILRYGTLIILVLQTTATVLLLRYSRTRPGTPYLASTAVMMNESCKFCVCVFSLYAQRGFSVRRAWRGFRDEILGKPSETFKLMVPSGLYCLQNNLLFLALTNLDAATYQVSTQLSCSLKCEVSQFFSSGHLSAQDFDNCNLLGVPFKEAHSAYTMAGLVNTHHRCLLSPGLSCPILREMDQTIDDSFFQLPTVSTATSDDAKVNSDIGAKNASLHQQTRDLGHDVLESHKQMIGLIAVLCACFSSGFAGVFFEKLVKTGAQQSVVIRNLQLGIFSLFFSTSAVIYNDMEPIMKAGFFQGYTPIVVIIIALQVGFTKIIHYSLIMLSSSRHLEGS